MLNRKRFWAIALAFMTALSVMGFTVGNLVAVNAQTSTYQDPAGRFEVALLPSYKMTPLAGIFVVESPEQDVAYTVSVRPKASDRYLEDAELAQVALDTVATGEGFIPGVFEGTDTGVQIPWQATQAGSPVNGTLVAKQTNNSVLVLAVSSTDSGTEKIAEILPELSQSLKPAQQ